jgi:hypothetical protein
MSILGILLKRGTRKLTRLDFEFFHRQNRLLQTKLRQVSARLIPLPGFLNVVNLRLLHIQTPVLPEQPLLPYQRFPALDGVPQDNYGGK